jgi:TRAP-type transport system periplasmic protein
LNTSEPNEANLLSNLRRGRTDCAGVSLQGAATVLPEVAVLQLPYLFSTFKEVDHVYSQPAFEQRFRQLFAAKGLAMIDWVEVGFVNVYGVQPIRTPVDVKGQKLRATQSRASQAFIKATGAEAVVLPFAELLPGLQTGLIRGGEAGVVVYDAVVGKTAPHYTLTGHAFDSGVVLCNKEWFDKLKPEHAKLVAGSWDTPWLIKAVRAQSEKIVADAASKGISVLRLNEAEQRAWREVGKAAAEAVMGTLPAEAAKIREELQGLIRAAPK